MTSRDLSERYESFQADAIRAIERDFGANPRGRYLLVIPTGGGKTITAAKAVNRLFRNGVLNPARDKALWTAHRIELLSQARQALADCAEADPTHDYRSSIILEMIGVAKDLPASDRSIRLTIIDEAHHGAASSYLPLFARPEMGILGLTATPTRHDGLPLEFERETYSIGFPDLVKRGVILKPEVRRVDGGKYDISVLDETSLGLLDNRARNQAIIAELLRRRDDYRKTIIYVGTKDHVRSLYAALCASRLAEHYESIASITGEGNNRNEEREIFIAKEKKWKRAILVNVHVLSEGYDDPAVNTVVMATPTASKLYYMQAIGRCIRHDPGNLLKKAYIVEVTDELPNIRYRIDNRWLYSDVSDALEPAVVDSEYGSAEELRERLRELCDGQNVPAPLRPTAAFDPDDRYSLLFFRRYVKPGTYENLPVLISRRNRQHVSNMFNFLSERMAAFKQEQIHAEAAFRRVGESADAVLPDPARRRWVYQAMENAAPSAGNDGPDFVRAGRPWITFAALHYRRREAELAPELVEFLRGMVNADTITAQICSRDFEPGASVIRLPLPLGGFLGKIVTAQELGGLERILDRLRSLKKTHVGKDHRAEVRESLGSYVLPIELAHSDSLVLVVRDNIAFSYRLT